MRFTSVICQQLDAHCRQDWKRTTERKVINLNAVTKKLSMPAIPGDPIRTLNYNREIQQRKAEIEAISSEQWLGMEHEYMHGKKDETS